MNQTYCVSAWFLHLREPKCFPANHRAPALLPLLQQGRELLGREHSSPSWTPGTSFLLHRRNFELPDFVTKASQTWTLFLFYPGYTCLRTSDKDTKTKCDLCLLHLSGSWAYCRVITPNSHQIAARTPSSALSWCYYLSFLWGRKTSVSTGCYTVCR